MPPDFCRIKVRRLGAEKPCRELCHGSYLRLIPNYVGVPCMLWSRGKVQNAAMEVDGDVQVGCGCDSPRARRLIFSICAFAEGVGDRAVHGSLWREVRLLKEQGPRATVPRPEGALYRRPPGRCCFDGQAGLSRAGPAGGAPKEKETGEEAPVYGLTISGPGLVPHVDPAFRVEAGMSPLDLVVEAPGSLPTAKAASSGGILGDVDNTRRGRLLRRPAGGPVQPERLHRHAQQRGHLLGRRRRSGGSGRRLAHRRLAQRSLRPGLAGGHRRARGSGRFAVSRPFAAAGAWLVFTVEAD